MWSTNRHISIEEHSYRQLVQQYNPLLFSIISQKINQREDVKDLIQDVHIHLWRYRDSLNRENVEAIIINTCRQKIAAFYRSVATIETKEDSLNENIVDTDWEMLSEEKERRLVQLDMAIENLFPPIRQKIFRMNKIEGMTQDNIAARLNISKRNVKFHIEQSLSFIKKHFKIHKNS
ncbi:sigma-70 family RNA polymerase sigma factor [Chryseobacterium sp. 2987]|uniref:sigma-70 family RNA polymerase sigma factor n=1 Tax=Chryseobacterium sp. 2987 TaxID=2817767 RepID=UPI00285F36DD|nr:sigma-70 family RNA polymerase sigma factor [Chryseobacterium sp. 2987]MDR6919506.1 RNA polymerase sigma factor (sigma-70 family) [Chryseobacterium sp. 2987]